MDYKVKGWLADQEYDGMNVKSTVFLATVIRVNGRLWGVLVLDSTDPGVLPGQRNRADRQANLESVALSLSVLLI